MIEVLFEPAAFLNIEILTDVVEILNGLKDDKYSVAWSDDYNLYLGELSNSCSPDNVEMKNAINLVWGTISMYYRRNVRVAEKPDCSEKWEVSPRRFSEKDKNYSFLQTIIPQYYQADRKPVLFVKEDPKESRIFFCGERRIIPTTCGSYNSLLEICNEADTISYQDFKNMVLASWPKNKNSGDAFKDAFQQYFGHEKQGAKNSFEFTREFIGDIARADKKNLSGQVTKRSLIDKICLRIRMNVSDANKELNDTPFDNNCKDGTAFNRLSQSMTPQEKESWRHYHVSGGARIHYHLYKREGEPPRIVFKHFYPESEHFD